MKARSLCIPLSHHAFLSSPPCIHVTSTPGCGESTKEGDPEKMSKLPCGHSFHDFCIRGWCIIGKKETCPYCGEKVDLKVLYPQPWSLERQDVLFSQLLDAIRYLVVWQPVIITLVKGINAGLGLQ
jgi:RING finger protein 121